MSLERAHELAEQAVGFAVPGAQRDRAWIPFVQSWAEFLRTQHRHYDAHARLLEIGELVKNHDQPDGVGELIAKIEEVLEREL